MARKKRIAIIMGRIYKKINKNLISGMLEQAKALGYSAFIFALNEECDNKKITHGEKNLFHALDFSLIDGVVYAPYTFCSYDYYGYIDNFLAENCPKPIVRVGLENGQFAPVWYNDRSEIAEITLHLIYGHNCKKLLCLTGPAEMPVAENRAKGFIDAIRKAGLDDSADNVIYGDFWLAAAKKLADEIAGHIREMPDAVVCTNDTMALALCDALTELGYSVPNDIRVTGYDGITETRMHVPSITTYRTSQEMLGRRSVCLLYEQITGEHCEPVRSDSGVILCRESCGCDTRYEREEPYDNDRRLTEEGYMDCMISAAFHDAETLDELVDEMMTMRYKFMYNDKYAESRLFLCLCSDWDNVGSEYRRDGYSDTMYLIGTDGSRCNFRLDEILPEALDTTDFSATFFLPVHFQDQCYGYIALDLQENIDNFNMEYIKYCREVNNALKYLSTKNELKRLLYRQSVSLSRDELTGLYVFENCRNMWAEIRDSSIENHEQLYMVAVTAGGIRHIKNKYGSVESDKCIMVIADILSKSCRSREWLFKAADRSFVIIGSGRRPEKRADEYIKKIDEKMWKHTITGAENHILYARSESMIVEDTAALTAYDVAEIIEGMLRSIDERAKKQLSSLIHYSELLKLRRDIFVHPERSWSGDICSRKLSISKSYFYKIYSQTFGVNFIDDLQKSRLNCAKNLLTSTTLLLPDIAERCGYDYYNFMRVFKKEFGMTPTQYRKNAQ
ncbi:DNA-binding transcriptional regulator, LacI/PurR family [Ruminococcus sp. YE71]|uniref:substrate-binding domain-containing protein n=1 Tax=unclassified Ruminococcus TaxID=2608920 RepID=UPI000891B15F|nr:MULTISPECIES: substrate-binding domain-containing protein [unclassified Ruminococcus]SDA26667.1 DNA-binding transcriptional regulator, LacI/PurR family [Ruminococcus sp. YE78]SFW44369.1 DNA-binding transcriptional regulator, LacI/PurR family [Ruminococcus sp. YE71]